MIFSSQHNVVLSIHVLQSLFLPAKGRYDWTWQTFYSSSIQSLHWCATPAGSQVPLQTRQMKYRIGVFMCVHHVCNRWVRGGVFFPLLSRFPECLKGVEDFIRGWVQQGIGEGGVEREDEQRKGKTEEEKWEMRGRGHECSRNGCKEREWRWADNVEEVNNWACTQ